MYTGIFQLSSLFWTVDIVFLRSLLHPEIYLLQTDFDMLSRSMKERSLLSWVATLATWALVYGLPYLIDIPALLHAFAENVFGSNYTRMFKFLVIITATLPWLIATTFYFSLYYFKFPSTERFRIQEFPWNLPESKRKEQYMLLIRSAVRSMFVKNILWYVHACHVIPISCVSPSLTPPPSYPSGHLASSSLYSIGSSTLTAI
jgi:hypothetical protein